MPIRPIRCDDAQLALTQ
jgi:hypothetical protein